MVSAEKFCLRWNDFESNINVAFRELREDKDFFDVTLACDDDQIQAHKVILSACSPFFRTILKRNSHEHPLLYLKGVKYIDLVSVLNFMYHGEVNVAQEELNSFLAIAEDLKVKGLTQNKSEDSPRQRQDVQTVASKQPRDPPAIQEQTKQLKRSPPVEAPGQTKQTARLGTIQTSYQADDYDIQEIVPVKTEPVSIPQEPQDDHQNQAADNSMAMYEDNFAAYENYEESTEPTYDGAMMSAAKVDENKALDLAISNCMALVYDEVAGVKVWQCLHCNKTNKDKSAISRHVESHLDGQSHSCGVCYKTYKTRFSLKVHMTREHRK